MDIKLTIDREKALIQVEGVISTDNAFTFQEKLNEVKASGVKLLEIDFAACRILCSTAIGKLMLFYKDFTATGGNIEIIKCSPSVFELFDTIRLSSIIKVSL